MQKRGGLERNYGRARNNLFGWHYFATRGDLVFLA